MQPEQQNQTPAPNNIPDYLGMEPVRGQPQKKSHKLRVVLIVIFILLFLAGGVMASLWLQGESERRFYQAIDNMMQTKHVSLTGKATMVSDNQMLETSIDVSTDFSDPSKPLSEISYQYVRSKDKENNEKGLTLKGDIVVSSSSGFFATLAEAPDGFLPKEASLGQWYEIANPDENTDTKSAAVYDYLGLRNLNAAFGMITVGNINQSSRSVLMDYIRKSKVYSIKSVDEVKVDGELAMAYTISVNELKLQALRKKIEEILKTDQPSIIMAQGETTMWVRKSTNRIMKIESKQDNETTRIISTINFSYPTRLMISKPDAELLP